MTYEEFEKWVVQDFHNTLVEDAVRVGLSRERSEAQAERFSSRIPRSDGSMLRDFYGFSKNGEMTEQEAHDNALHILFSLFCHEQGMDGNVGYFWSMHGSVLKYGIGNSGFDIEDVYTGDEFAHIKAKTAQVEQGNYSGINDNDGHQYEEDYGEIDFFAANPVEAKEWYLGNRYGGEQDEYTLFIEKIQARYFKAYIRTKPYATFSLEISVGDPESFEEAFENAMAVVYEGKCFEQLDDMLRRIDSLEFGFNFRKYKNETYGPTYAFWDTERQLGIGISGEEEESDREVFIWKNGMHNRLRIAYFDSWDNELGEHFSKSTPEIMAIVDNILEEKGDALIKKLEEINKEDVSSEISR